MTDGATADNLIQPFHLAGGRVRGQLVRLGETVDTILRRHDYPETVLELLGEAVALTALLSATLKFDGIFTLQTQSDGPVSLMVTDFRTGGHLRAMAKFDEAAVEAVAAVGRPDLRQLLGAGHLAFTVDQGEDTERYQGIVELDGSSLVECAQTYLKQSEQLATAIALSAKHGESGWRAGGLMLQRMPGDKAHLELVDEDFEAWHTATVLMNSVSPEELVDPNLTGSELLYRLFHEDGVWVHDTRALVPQCRCSRERVENVLRSFPSEEITNMAEDGTVVVTCEFCNSSYRFDETEF